MSNPVAPVPYLPRPPGPNDTDTARLSRYLSTLTNTLFDHFMRIAEKVNISVRTDGNARMTAPLPLFAVTVADLADPTLDPALWPFAMLALSDGTMPIAISDGTDWLYPDGTTV